MQFISTRVYQDRISNDALRSELLFNISNIEILETDIWYIKDLLCDMSSQTHIYPVIYNAVGPFPTIPYEAFDELS